MVARTSVTRAPVETLQPTDWLWAGPVQGAGRPGPRRLLSVPGPAPASGASLASAQGLSLWKRHPDL